MLVEARRRVCQVDIIVLREFSEDVLPYGLRRATPLSRIAALLAITTVGWSRGVAALDWIKKVEDEKL